MVVIAEILLQHSAQMLFRQDDHVVEALAADAADQPLCVCILPRRMRRSDHLLDLQSFDSTVELFSEDLIPIPEKETRCGVFGECLHNLLSCPECCRVSGDVEVHDSSPIVREDDEAVQVAKSDGWNTKEINRDNLPGMITEEGLPGLRGRRSDFDPVFGDRELGDLKPEQAQFCLYARRAPERILSRHLANEVAEFGADLWSAWTVYPRLPSPEELKALSVPFDDGLEFDDDES